MASLAQHAMKARNDKAHISSHLLELMVTKATRCKLLLVQLAWTTVQNSCKACGEHAELTCEITSLHVNLQRLQRETAKVESPINRPSDTYRQDLAPIVSGCGKTLDVLDRVLVKYNALSDGERSKRKLWKAVRFGNGELANVKDLRLKLTYYTANLSLFLNMVSMGSMGVIEKQMYEAGGDLKEIRRAVNDIAAHLISSANKEGSVLTDYADDDKAVWRAFRRDLVKEGFSSDVIREHKDTIQAYVKELGSRGILDDEDLNDSGNVSEEIEDMEPTQATPKARDEAMGSFESISGAARDSVSPRTATTAYVDDLSGTGNRDPRENETISQKTQIAPASLTMNKVSDALPSTTQADAQINSVVERGSREAEKIDDRTNRHRFSAPIPSAQDKLLETVDNAIRRLFMPELEILKQEQKIQQSRQKEISKSSDQRNFKFFADALPSTTQADADINSLAESDSREVEKVDDRTIRHPSSAPTSLGQALPEIAEKDTWFLPLGDSRPSFRYYTWYKKRGTYVPSRSAYPAEYFGRLSGPLLVWVKILEFQAEADGFLKVAECRTRWRNPGLSARRQSMLKLSPLFKDHEQGFSIQNLLVIDEAHHSTIINDLMDWGLLCIDACPEKWRITEWRGNADGDKGKRSTVPPAASSAAGDTQNPSSTAEKVETEEDDEFQRTGNDPRPEEHKRSWREPLKEAKAMRKDQSKVTTSTFSRGFYPPRPYKDTAHISDP